MNVMGESFTEAEQYARQHLPELCRELIAWERTAHLSGDSRMWEVASRLPPALEGDVRQAEAFVKRLALRVLAETAPAGDAANVAGATP